MRGMAFAAVVLIALLAACSGGGEELPPRTPPPDSGAVPPLYSGWQDTEIDVYAQRADAIVHGYVVEVGNARWTTPDGKPPEGFTGASPWRTGYTIYARAVVEVIDVIAGDSVLGTIHVTSVGAELDGVSARAEDIGPVFAAGQEVVLFLYEPGRDLYSPRENWTSIQEFQVIGDDIGRERYILMSHDALLTEIEAALAMPENEWAKPRIRRFPATHSLTQAAVVADTIVRGTVVRVGDARWSTPDGRAPEGYDPLDERSDDHQFIYEAASIDISEVIAGRDVPARITVSSYGGTVDGQSWPPPSDSRTRPGGPIFEPGEEVILFLLEARTRDVIPDEYWTAFLDYHVTDGAAINRYFDDPVPVDEIIATAVDARASAMPPVE